MKIRELVLASLLISVLVVQTVLKMYIPFQIPFTLTYVVLNILARNTVSREINILSVLTFVIVKNMLYAAFPFTIVADIIGLIIFVLSARINKAGIRYTAMFVSIILHLLLLDLSTVLLLESNILAYMLLSIPAYIYGPATLVLIASLDGVNFVAEQAYGYQNQT